MEIKKFLLVFFLLLFTKIDADVLYLPLQKLISLSQEIIEGKVINIETKWDDEHKFIFTYTKIRIYNTNKGKVKDKEIILKEIGGQLDGYTTHAECQPNYKKGEEVLVFLQKRGSYYETYGLNQGKFSIINEGGGKIYKRDINLNELTFLDNTINKKSIKNAIEYNEFKKIIKNEVSR